ncbi:MAG: Flp pilus assembly protein CpaB [Thermomicrobiales bacterium]|nr:Flp pilus assembly protein CpaB [Thermomicrobiales bacterium]
MKGGSNRLFIIAGVGLALIAILLLVSNLRGGGTTTADEDEPDVPMGTVVEAKSAVAAHALITIDALVERQVPVEDVPADAVTSISEAAGMAYRVPLTVGQPLLRTQLELPGLRNDIAPGKRAIALPVNEISSMSGLVQDGDYVDIIFNARVNLLNVVETEDSDAVSEEQTYTAESATLVPYGEEGPENYALPGSPNSTFIIRDDLGESGQLEAVAKIVLQDIRILRVIRPGDQFLADGSRAGATVAEGAEQGAVATIGQVVLEVTPQQAELVNFIQDGHHSYQVIVRGQDDHENVTTTGITYSILVADDQWALPVPKSVTLDGEGVVVVGTPVAEEDADAEPSDEDEQ